MKNRKVCVFINTRGNYGKLYSTMLAIQASKNLELQLVVGGALLDSNYGDHRNIILRNGFQINALLEYPSTGETLTRTAIAAGICTSQAGRILSKLKPDFVLIIADRYESLSIAHAAVCLNFCIVHLEGGEVSGSIDERIRHCISKLAHYHLVANTGAASRVAKMGEHEDNIFVTGSPSFDLLDQINYPSQSESISRQFTELQLSFDTNISDDYLVISFHPVVTEYDKVSNHVGQLVEAIKSLHIPSLWVVPNDDSGALVIREYLRKVINNTFDSKIEIIGSLETKAYALLLKHSLCLVGNSSSGIREAAFLGVPAVNIGSRQNGRQRGINVIDVAASVEEIRSAVKTQIKHGSYEPDTLYGDGKSGPKIVQILASISPIVEKLISY